MCVCVCVCVVMVVCVCVCVCVCDDGGEDDACCGGEGAGTHTHAGTQ